MGEFADEVRRSWGIDGFGVRVGVESGPVVVGAVGAGSRVEYSAMGDAVNVAARLETVAEPGQVVIGESTRARLPANAAVEPLGELAVKGRRGGVVAFRLTGLCG
jgi:class 3 adenylate cyclase